MREGAVGGRARRAVDEVHAVLGAGDGAREEPDGVRRVWEGADEDERGRFAGRGLFLKRNSTVSLRRHADRGRTTVTHPGDVHVGVQEGRYIIEISGQLAASLT